MGLLLIPAGMWLERRKLLRDPTAVADWPVVDFRRAEVRRTALAHRGAHRASTSSSFCWPGTAACTRWNRRRFCGQACHTPMRPAVPGLAGRGCTPASPVSTATSARARRDSCTRSWPASGSWRWSSPIVSEADSARRQDAARRAGGDVQGLPPARTRHRRSHPRHPRVRRRRGEHRDDDGAADARGRHEVIGRARFTGTPILPFASSTWRPTRSGRRSRTCE